MSLKIPTSLTIPLEKKGLTYKFVTKVFEGKRQITCEIRTRDTNQLVLSETGPNENDALRKAAQAASGVPRPLRDDEARRKLAEQEREIANLKAKLESAQAPAPEPETDQADEPVKRGRRRQAEEPVES